MPMLSLFGVVTCFMLQRAPSSPHLARGLNRSFFPQFCSGLTAGWAVGWIEDFGGRSACESLHGECFYGNGLLQRR